jgi:hypothetical protein
MGVEEEESSLNGIRATYTRSLNFITASPSSELEG